MVRIPKFVGTWGYKPRKAAHAAAFFVLRSGGTINVLKLVKLLYLTEREYMNQYDDPMFYDRFVSMEHGPVPSITLNLINGLTVSDDWTDVIGSRGKNYEIGLSNLELNEEDLDELSDADAEVLDNLWSKFGDLDRFELVKYTHENCPEWEDPDGSSFPIPHERVYKFLNKKNAHELSEDIQAHRQLISTIERG